MLRFTKFFAVGAMIAGAAGCASTAGAQAATSLVKPISLGISGGAAIPTGSLSDGANTGYNVTGSIAVGLTGLPFSIRGDAAFNSFGVKDNIVNSVGADNANARILGFTGNLVLPLPLQGTVLRPYLIGGVGLYNVRYSSSINSGGGNLSASQSENRVGFNFGGGLTIPLAGFNAFIEARYHRVSTDNGSTAFVPITFGVMF